MLKQTLCLYTSDDVSGMNKQHAIRSTLVETDTGCAGSYEKGKEASLWVTLRIMTWL